MFSWMSPEWFSAVTSSIVTGIVGVLLGTFVKARVEKNVQHNLDAKLEALRSALRKEEQALRAELDAKGDEIIALRSGALSGLANRYAALDKRRLEALDKLWAAVVNLGRYEMVGMMTRSLKMDLVLEVAAGKTADAANFRKFADLIWEAAKLDTLPTVSPPDTERPFVSPLAWALFSAYRQALVHPIAQLGAMRAGTGSKILADAAPLLQLVKSALPHRSEYIDKFGTAGLTNLFEELKESLLAEIQRGLHNPNADQANLEQANQILAAANKLAQSAQKPIELPAELTQAQKS